MDIKTCTTKQAFREEFLQHFHENIVKKCKDSAETTDEDITAVKMYEVPTTQGAKCFAACVLEKIGTVGNTRHFTEITLIN